MSSLKQVARRVAHAAALIFGAWWLMATSAVQEPARECFTGIADRTQLQVVLDPTPLTPDPNVQSCGALDGLMPGSTLVFDISKGGGTSGECFDYDTLALTPALPGVTLHDPAFDKSFDLTSTGGAFSWPTDSACRGEWVLSLSPGAEPAPDQQLSPLDAGPAQKWIVGRAMTLEQGQFCGGVIVGSGNTGCADTFGVVSITDLGAP
jgi:hypothetical protein